MLTSNRTRELHDALKRRCLYHWIDYPAREREAEIVRARLPGVPEAIVARVCAAVERLRAEELYKVPGVGETITWARALLALGPDDDLDATLGVALKVREDLSACARRACSRAPEPRGRPCFPVTAPSLRIGRSHPGPRCGVRVGVGELLAAHRALAAVDAGSREQAFFALRATFCSSHADH